MWSTIAVSTLCVLSVACAEDVAIYGSISTRGEPEAIALGEGSLGSVSVGVLGEHAVVQWIRSRPDGDDSPTALWLDADLAAVGEPIEMGVGSPYASRFVEREGALVAQVWASPPGEPWRLGDAAYWRLAPPPAEPSRLALTLDVVEEEDPFRVLHIGAARFGVGPEGKLPIAASGFLLSAVGATPSSCGRDGFRQIHLVDEVGVGTPLSPGLCSAAVPETGNAWLFDVDDETVGMLYRQHPVNDGRIRFLRLRADGTPESEPVVVGLDLGDTFSTVDGGFQPRAVATATSVLFTERYGAANTCHVLRIMALDGTRVRDAPWQLPCRSYDLDDLRSSRRVTASVELLALEQGALLIYAEHSFAGAGTITEAFPWSEAIHAVLIDAEGRQGSDVVTVTDASATALDPVPRTASDGPFARSFVVGADAAGSRAVVAWYDRRPEHPGIYVRELRVTFRSAAALADRP